MRIIIIISVQAGDALNNWLGDLPDLDLADFDDWIKAPDSKQDSEDNAARAASTQTTQWFQDTAQPLQTQRQRSSLSGSMPEWLQSKMFALGNVSASSRSDNLQGLPPLRLGGNQEGGEPTRSSGAQGRDVEWDRRQVLSASPSNQPDAICNQLTPQQGMPEKQDWRQPPSGAYSTVSPSEVPSALRAHRRQQSSIERATQYSALQSGPQQNTSGGHNNGGHPLANTLSSAGAGSSQLNLLDLTIESYFNAERGRCKCYPNHKWNNGHETG